MARAVLNTVMSEKLQTKIVMKTKIQMVALMSAVVMSLAVAGCDRTISHEESSKMGRDGTVTTKEKTESVNQDGTVTKKEETKKTTP